MVSSDLLYRLFLTEGKLQLRGFQKHQDKVEESSRMRLFSWQSFNTETWFGSLDFVCKKMKRYLSMSLCLTKASITSFLVSPIHYICFKSSSYLYLFPDMDYQIFLV